MVIQKHRVVAFCGTRGIPANYGGFETAVDEISARFVREGINVEIFCRKSCTNEMLFEHNNRNLIYVSGSKYSRLDTFISSLQTGIYLLKNRRKYKHILWFNNANFPGIVLSLLSGIPVTVNTDGLEWRRKKWSWPFKLYYWLSSFLISRICSDLISDSKAIQTYYQKVFNKNTHFIPYGIPRTIVVSDKRQQEILDSYGLSTGKFFLQITRFEPDNLPLEIAHRFSYSQLYKDGYKFLIIGYKEKTHYAEELKKLSGIDGIEILAANYDQEVLATLRHHCYCYMHGNSVGGTNPAMIEAMATCPRILAIDTEFSREMLGTLGTIFTLDTLVKEFSNSINYQDQRNLLYHRVKINYQWEAVAKAYLELVEGRGANYKVEQTLEIFDTAITPQNT
jgi:glycosyltransferase involved in cell wall biosynthesis